MPMSESFSEKGGKPSVGLSEQSVPQHGPQPQENVMVAHAQSLHGIADSLHKTVDSFPPQSPEHAQHHAMLHKHADMIHQVANSMGGGYK